MVINNYSNRVIINVPAGFVVAIVESYLTEEYKLLNGTPIEDDDDSI